MCGACVAGILGAVVSFPFLRLRGDYLALATFGLAIIVYSISRNWTSVTSGPMGVAGIPGFSILGVRLSSAKSFALLAASFVALTCFVISRVIDSPFGRVLRGIREDEMAALAMGKNVSKYKITVFALGAFFAGIAGSLYAHYITFIDPSSFTPMESIVILLMVVFGGAGSIAGSFFGASILVVFPEFLRFLGMPSFLAAPLRQMIYGLLLIVLMLKRPQGVWGKYKFR
jgi:branched-chain amino acid transport system permease protein